MIHYRENFVNREKAVAQEFFPFAGIRRKKGMRDKILSLSRKML